VLARPAVCAAWALTDPAARQYVSGWASGGELHVLSAGDDLTAAALYVRHVVLPRSLRRLSTELRWAWLLEGTARWFAGQTERMGQAIARRLRKGPRPSFPPGLRDAVLLGGTVVDLIVREEGERAAVELARTLPAGGPRAALARAFGDRPFRQTEAAWRSHLDRITGSRRSRAT
jgi:hypothetical protein